MAIGSSPQAEGVTIVRSKAMAAVTVTGVRRMDGIVADPTDWRMLPLSPGFPFPHAVL
jgi:hypothetical protein